MSARRDMRGPREPVTPARRWPRHFAIVLVFTGISFTGWGISLWLTAPETLPITDVVVEGEFVHVDRGTLEAQVRTSIRGGFFSVDIDAVASAVAAEPWVYAVGIHREWPGRLRIQVVEQVAAARWNGTALLNAEGEVFDPPRESFPAGLPSLAGVAGRERELLMRHAQTRALLETRGLAVRGLIEDARRALTIELEGGARIVMGRGEDNGRLARLLRAWPRVVAQREVPLRQIDLRYTNGFAVAWQDATAVM